jgi:hypothetical protein
MHSKEAARKLVSYQGRRCRIKDNPVCFLTFFTELLEGYLREVEQENNKLKNDLEQLEFILYCEKDAMIVNVRK